MTSGDARTPMLSGARCGHVDRSVDGGNGRTAVIRSGRRTVIGAAPGPDEQSRAVVHGLLGCAVVEIEADAARRSGGPEQTPPDDRPAAAAARDARARHTGRAA